MADWIRPPLEALHADVRAEIVNGGVGGPGTGWYDAGIRGAASAA